jgi:hypothetical protein
VGERGEGVHVASPPPLVATYLISRTGNDFVPAYYVMAVSAISFVALLGLPETAGTRGEVTGG